MKDKTSIILFIMIIIVSFGLIAAQTTKISPSFNILMQKKLLGNAFTLELSTNSWSGHINATDVVSTESTSDGDAPSIAVDGSGNVHVVWEDWTNIFDAGTDLDIFYKFWNASSDTWSGQINDTDVISTESGGPSVDPSIAVDDSGNMHVVWRDNTDIFDAGADFDIFYKFWNASSGTWSGHFNNTDVVSTGSALDSDIPSIAVDGSGNVHVAWDDSTNIFDAGPDRDIFYKFWNASSGTWSGHINATDVVSTESTGASNRASIAVDGSGNVHVAWDDATNIFDAGPNDDIFYKFWSVSSGTWSGHFNATDVVSTESTDDSEYPSIAVDRSGNVHVAWQDWTNIFDADTDLDIFYKFWSASSGTWSGHINDTDVVSTESTGDCEYPSIAVDGSGNVHVAWKDWTNIFDADIDDDIFYKFWSASSGTWSGHVNATDVVSTESTNDGDVPSIAVDSLGNVHVVWADWTNIFDAGTDRDIFYKYLAAMAISAPPQDLTLLLLLMLQPSDMTLIIALGIGIGAAGVILIIIILIRKRS